VRDSQRQRVYDAEIRLRELFDVAERIENREVTLDGIRLQLPPEAKFACLSSIQSYVDTVVGRGRVKVRERKGGTRAHYEPWTKTIAISMSGTRWQLREIVVLHELAHHLTRSEHTTNCAAHGPEFVATFTQLLADTMGPEVGLAYRVLCSHEGAEERKPA